MKFRDSFQGGVPYVAVPVVQELFQSGNCDGRRLAHPAQRLGRTPAHFMVLVGKGRDQCRYYPGSRRTGFPQCLGRVNAHEYRRILHRLDQRRYPLCGTRANSSKGLRRLEANRFIRIAKCDDQGAHRVLSTGVNERNQVYRPPSYPCILVTRQTTQMGNRIGAQR